MNSSSILYLAINLESSVDRRNSILEQSQKLGMDIQLVKAIAGKDLGTDDLSGYDRVRRRHEFISDMTFNEQACIKSHCKALRLFLEQGHDFCVVFEDDVLISPSLPESVQYLMNNTSGWECCKLWTEDSKLYFSRDQPSLAPVHLVFPKKLPWNAQAILYTRKGAQSILEGFKRYWMAYDVQWAQILLSRQIPVCGVTPSLVANGDLDGTDSNIDKGQPRQAVDIGKTRSLSQYVWHRLATWQMSFGKFFMRMKLRRVLRIDGK